MSRKTAFLLITVLICTFLFSVSVYAQTYPEIVRIGLYSGSDAVSSVSFSANAGLEIGYYKDGKFVIIDAIEGGKQLIVRKDAYFIKSSDGILQEYNPSEGIPFMGETFGPVHIQIGGKVSDYASARGIANTITGQGIIAYPAYKDDGWAVWTGFYGDVIQANEDIDKLKNKLGIDQLTVIEPSDVRFIVYNSNFEPSFVFESSKLRLTVHPNDANSPKVLSVNGKKYRGEIELRRFSDSDITVINILNIEEYLYGVVPKEIGPSSPLEALKAQAVAARTYAYRHKGSYSKWDFDMVNTVNSQVYGGYDAEHPNTNRAVDETKGKKVLYNGKPAQLFYFSSSGGMTEDVQNVWGSKIEYLKSVPDPYESGTSYNYNWTRKFTAEEIKMKLFLNDVEIGDIISMTAEEYSSAGRVTKLKITGTKGSVTYYNEDIRRILGDNGAYLPSRMFTITSGSSGSTSETVSVLAGSGKTNINLFGAKVVTSSGIKTIQDNSSGIIIAGANTKSVVSGIVSDGTFVLTGKGWGHGVGMSQEGAKGFARNGYTYDQILMHYFPGTTVE
ncbi:MAG: SpoIID/LytB domain-containing protein [Clostridiaceae bacterium]|nr:SpoIID/LytB domain-containing protein [Clostridiaceae bacterium]